MTLAALKASLSLWKRRLGSRKKLLANAKQDYLEARTADVHPRQHLKDKVALREQQVEEAENRIKLREDQIAKKNKGKVRRPAEKVKMNVVCQSSRGGVKPRLIVLHTTEGNNVPNSAQDLVGLGQFFNRSATQASSHVGVDGDGYGAQYVPDDKKAWTQASFNPQALSVEQVGRAAQGTFPEAQLRMTAKYIAYWSVKYNIPITKSTTHGVCEHKHLGAAGGGHVDCGPNYPFERVLGYAREYVKNGW